MKTLILTGIANEISFAEGGRSMFYLVFNDGDLRLPVEEAVAEYAISAMTEEEEEKGSSTISGQAAIHIDDSSNGHGDATVDGVEYYSATDYDHPPSDDDDEELEDIDDGVGQF